jgi:predicted SAM-dependent methyltransferase
MERREKILSNINLREQKGLEIGALDRPVVTSDQGNIQYIDHISTSDLEAKYKDDKNVDTSKIVDVNFILGENTLAKTIGKENKFNYVIASHVIEHVPDVIGWLKDISAILYDGGILSLAIPDKRFTFDYLRTPTTCGDLIESHMQKLSRPSPKQVFDFFSNAVSLDTGLRWSGRLNESELNRQHSIKFASKMAKQVFEDGEYTDVHCTVYTPRSFFQLIEMMLELELIDFRIIDFHDTSENELEFFVSFEKLSISANEDVSRYKMSKSIPHIVTDTWENTQQKRFLELEKSISRLTEQNKILFSEKDVLNDKLSLSDSELLESNTKLKEIIHQFENTCNQLEQTYQSTSWKITKPIRNLKTMVTNFLRPNAHK